MRSEHSVVALVLSLHALHVNAGVLLADFLLALLELLEALKALLVLHGHCPLVQCPQLIDVGSQDKVRARGNHFAAFEGADQVLFLKLVVSVALIVEDLVLFVSFSLFSTKNFTRKQLL